MASALETLPVRRHFKGGEPLFNEGDGGAELYVIQLGSVVVSKLIDGTATTLAELTVGDFVGELAVVSGGNHTTTAIAAAETSVLVIDGPTLESMVTQDSEIAVRFIRGLVERLAASHELLAVVGARDARTRVCMAIIRHAEASVDRRPEGIWIGRPMRDIGDEVAVSEEELGEISKTFIRQQLLRIKRDGVLVPDVSRLYDLVN